MQGLNTRNESQARIANRRVMGMCCALSLALMMPSMTAHGQDDATNGNRPTQNQGSPQNPIELNFEDTPLLKVVSSIGALTGRNFEVDPNLASDKVTIISHHKVAPELAYEILESILKSKGYNMIETLDGNLIRIVKQTGPGQVDTDKLEIYNNTREAHIGFDNYAIHLVQLQYVPAEEASEILQQVGSRNAAVTVFQNTNMLLIIDTADGVRNMFEVLKSIDIPGYDVQMQIFQLQYTRAEALGEQLTQVLIGDNSGAGARAGQPQQRPVVQPRNTRTAAIPGQPQTTVVGSAEEVLRVVPDERLNSIIVIATASMMSQVEKLIAKLDTPTPNDSNNIHYVSLLHTDAESVATVLEAVSNTAPRKGNEGPADGEVQPFEKKVTVTSYEENNALLIIASPQDFEVLKLLIEQLDTPRKQVNIEAIIMEVTIGDSFEVTVEGAALNEASFFGLSNVVDLANVLTSGPAALAGAGGSLGIIDGTTDVLLPGATDPVTVQNVPLLMRALETITDVEILSRPNLLMKDNTEGQLTVGQEIPIPTAQSDINPNSGFSSRNTLSRRDVGIKLTVTPQINEGDYVSMEIEVESSSTVESSVGIDVNNTGATIAQSLVTSEVVVQDGQTGIIGGLIREAQNTSVAQVPWLGDIPILGNLFKGRNKGRNKQNLVVLVTPRIVDRGDDMDNITQRRVEEFYSYNLDAIFEKGFIKKVKSKHKTRFKDRPTDPFNPEKNGGNVFNSETTE